MADDSATPPAGSLAGLLRIGVGVGVVAGCGWGVFKLFQVLKVEEAKGEALLDYGRVTGDDLRTKEGRKRAERIARQVEADAKARIGKRGKVR